MINIEVLNLFPLFFIEARRASTRGKSYKDIALTLCKS